MRRIGIGCAVMAFWIVSGSAVWAQQGTNAAPPSAPGGERMVKPMPPMEDVSVSGKITKNEIGRYVLTVADGGKVLLPAVKKAAPGEKAETPDLEKYVGKDVTVQGKGHVLMKTSPSGEKSKKVRVLTITDVKEMAAAPAAEPAKTEAPKGGAPATEAPKTEAPRVEAPKAEAPAPAK